MWETLWRAKKSRFQASVDSGMKKEIRTIDNYKSKYLGKKSPKKWTI